MKPIVTFSIAVTLASSAFATESIYSLYRTSLVDGVAKVHIATFDTTNGGDYNLENCQLTAELFQNQPNVETKFWCEQGRAEND
jgi:hypothetical protein